MSDRWLLVDDASQAVVAVCLGQPTAPAGQTAYSSPDGVGMGWLRQAEGSFLDPHAPKPPTGADLADYASRRRWEIEVGGTTWNGWPVATDDRSKILTDGELTAIDLGVRQDGEQFKFADGMPRPLSNDQMKAVAIQMRAHVKGTFGALFQAIAGIQGGTVTTTAQVDAILAQASA